MKTLVLVKASNKTGHKDLLAKSEGAESEGNDSSHATPSSSTQGGSKQNHYKGKLKSKKIPKESNENKRSPAQTTEEMIAEMEEETLATEREEIFQTMTPAFDIKLKYIDNWLREEVAHSVRRRYDLGLQVLEMYEDEQNGSRLYGDNAIGRICKLLKWDDGVIYLSLRFVQTYSKEEVDHLCTLLLPSGAPLTWSHVRVLLAVEDADRREELLEKTIKKGLTCTSLAYEVKALQPHSPNDHRGRPPKTPKDFDGAIALQEHSAKEWERQHARIWAVPEKSLIAQAAKLSPEEITDAHLSQVRDLAMHLRRVANQAAEQAEKAEKVVKDFECILEERQLRVLPEEASSKK
jgi:hypothetical protein